MAAERLLASSRIIVTTHINPDGDALGSEGALYHYLLRKGKSVRIINTSPSPANLSLLTGGGIFEEYAPGSHDEAIQNADIVVVLDVNAVNRLDRMKDIVASTNGTILVIDHHTEPQPFADFYLTDTAVSATGELIYDLISMDEGARIDETIALHLYVAIVTDTGSFRFERTSPKVHRIAAQLLETGLFPPRIHEQVYDSYPLNRTRLLGMALERVQPCCGGKATIMSITDNMFRDTGTTYEDTEGMVNFGLSIHGVSATALVAELEDCVKVSLRSRGDVHINALARSLGGGGHLFAAGARISGSAMDDVIKQIIEGFELIYGDSRQDL